MMCWSRRQQGRGRGFEGCGGHRANMPFMFALLQHGGTARTQGVSQWSRRQQGRGRGFEGCGGHDALMPSMFAPLQHGGTARTQGVSQMEPAPAGERVRV